MRLGKNEESRAMARGVEGARCRLDAKPPLRSGSDGDPDVSISDDLVLLNDAGHRTSVLLTRTLDTPSAKRPARPRGLTGADESPGVLRVTSPQGHPPPHLPLCKTKGTSLDPHEMMTLFP